MNEITEIANKHDLWVVEDAACGFGSTYHGQHVGNFGAIGCFSFHPRKAITTGEGGMIKMSNGDPATKLRQLRDHGAALFDLQRHQGPQPYLLADHPMAGYNQRMTDIQAALGAEQMKGAAEIVSERRRLAGIYDEAFFDLEWLRLPAHMSNCEHGYQSYPCLFEPAKVNDAVMNGLAGEIENISSKRNEWMKSLYGHEISTRPATHSVHTPKFYADRYRLQPMDFPSAYATGACSVSLPLFHGKRQQEVSRVISAVRTSTL
jgi:dTDP-4-amino-4,6-dideoxygalactose transaminase